MKNSNIIVLTGAIRTGKSTALHEWVQNKNEVGGFIALDIEGKRKLLDLKKDIYRTFQIKEKETELDIEIGKFIFSADSFKWARKTILEAIDNTPKYFVVDELGKLEMIDKGLQPALGNLIIHYQKMPKLEKNNHHLILVIRDTLLDAAIKKFDLQGCTIIKKEQINDIL